MNQVTISHLKILTGYYSNWYEILEMWEDVYDTLERYGERKYSHKSFCKNIGKILENDEKNSFVKWIIKETFYCWKKLKKIVDKSIKKNKNYSSFEKQLWQWNCHKIYSI